MKTLLETVIEALNDDGFDYMLDAEMKITVNGYTYTGIAAVVKWLVMSGVETPHIGLYHAYLVTV